LFLSCEPFSRSIPFIFLLFRQCDQNRRKFVNWEIIHQTYLCK
jgi:hypothetical protein